VRQALFFAFILANASPGFAGSCIDPATLVQSTANISREFGEEERKESAGVLGIRGTGWFFSPRLIVTAAHVAEAMHLTAYDWKEIEVREGEKQRLAPARILRLAGASSEKMAVLELGVAFAEATLLAIRTEPLVPEERVVTIGYPKSHLRFAEGRFVEYGADAKYIGAALLEIHYGNDRLVLDHGASGAPVLDCDGRVVAVVSTVITQTVNLPSGPVRVSTAWQTPNVISIPADSLREVTSVK
jgi:Trypsin-like peptidase domain